MNETLEQLIAQGEAIVEEKERNEAIQHIAAEEKARQERDEVKEKFMEGLKELIPAAVISELGPVDEMDILNGRTELRFAVDGCPIYFEVIHKKGELLKINGNTPFVVAGIEAFEPAIYEGDLYQGSAKYAFGNRTSKGYVDLIEALGTARKQAQKMVEIQVSNDELYVRLADRFLEEKKAEKLPEPVYVSEDSQLPSQTGCLLNMEELYLFVRGIVTEVNEEQRA